jgi:twinkle protein
VGRVRGLSVAEAINEAKQYLGVRDTCRKRAKSYLCAPGQAECRDADRDARVARSRGLRIAPSTPSRSASGARQAWALFPYLRDGVYVNGKYRNPADKKDMQQEGRTPSRACSAGT